MRTLCCFLLLFAALPHCSGKATRSKGRASSIYINTPDSSVKASITDQSEKNPQVGRYYHWYAANQLCVTNGGYSGKLLHGSYSSFYTNHSLLSQGQFCYGLKDGCWKRWLPDGRLHEIIHYKKGQLNGVYEFYSPSGKILERRYYRKGARAGKTTIFSQDGSDSVVVVEKRRKSNEAGEKEQVKKDSADGEREKSKKEGEKERAKKDSVNGERVKSKEAGEKGKVKKDSMGGEKEKSKEAGEKEQVKKDSGKKIKGKEAEEKTKQKEAGKKNEAEKEDSKNKPDKKNKGDKKQRGWKLNWFRRDTAKEAHGTSKTHTPKAAPEKKFDRSAGDRSTSGTR